MTAYSDASWADCPDTGRSTGGYVVYQNGGPVAFSSRVLPTVALSTAESELMAMTECSKSLMHLRYVNNDWDTPGREEKHEPHDNWGDIYSHKECDGDSYNVEWETQDWPSEMHGDNASTLLMLGDVNASITSRSKHIAARYFWCRDKVKEGEITLHKVDTTENVSDIMTKSLTSATFKKHAENMLETIKSKSAVDFSKLTKALERSQVATIDFS